ncbi:hypothetical protein MMIC_P0240 [Mariprofundus micogutta]|uniref:SF3 helicase domain-containing protein n=1 Tax=Mariprofundus micogutta TaxID=1921010 RepID=A0A1L8CK69_9PROT|nr:phage/plasmid primase, P4 family [Mariprofundus micogutta]GAV19306.1 hypothetical protein MMIC_P0240 [Mariprofundus micogutta]
MEQNKNKRGRPKGSTNKKKAASLELQFVEKLRKTKDTYFSTYSDIFKWVDTHYAHVPFEQIEAEAAKWLARTEPDKATPNKATACGKLAMQMCDLLPVPKTDTIIIPVGNGYIHYDEDNNTFELKEHDPQYGLQYVLACDYDPTATNQEWVNFLDRVVPDFGVQDFLQEFIGYTLMPDNRYQCGLWLTGNGANGKGVFAKVVEQLHSATAAINLDSIGQYDMEGIIGSSLVIADEVGRHINNEQTVKKLVSGEPMQVNRKYLKVIKAFRNTAKIIALSNHTPKGGDQTDGFWRRWFLVPFEHKVPVSERIPNYEYIITQKGGLSGLLNWSLEGLQRLLERGHFDPPQVIREQLEQARISADSVLGWTSECVVERSDHCDADRQTSYAEYKEWCSANGLKSVGMPTFRTRLDELVGVLSEKRRQTRDGKRPYCINLTIGERVSTGVLYPCGRTQNQAEQEADNVPF